MVDKMPLTIIGKKYQYEYDCGRPMIIACILSNIVYNAIFLISRFFSIVVCSQINKHFKYK